MSPIGQDLGRHMSTEVATTLTRHMATANMVLPADELALITIHAVASAAASAVASFVASAAASNNIKTTPADPADALFKSIDAALIESRALVSARGLVPHGGIAAQEGTN